MNRIEISRELFDNVFEGCVFNYIKDNVIHYSQPCDIMEGSWVESETSINDFFFNCKEWAWNLDAFKYGIGSRKCFNGEYKAFIGIDNGEDEWYSYSEQQAVFDACEWILNQDIKSN